jgi:hypothetical protein
MHGLLVDFAKMEVIGGISLISYSLSSYLAGVQVPIRTMKNARSKDLTIFMAGASGCISSLCLQKLVLNLLEMLNFGINSIIGIFTSPLVHCMYNLEE